MEPGSDCGRGVRAYAALDGLPRRRDRGEADLELVHFITIQSDDGLTDGIEIPDDLDTVIEREHRLLAAEKSTSHMAVFGAVPINRRLFGDDGPGHHIELLEYRRPRGARGDPNTFNPGNGHVAFMVTDIDATGLGTLAELVEFSRRNERMPSAAA